MTRRYSLAPLIDASGLSEHALSQRVGLTGTPLIRARRNGLIESAADKYACRLGLVPWLVWSDWLVDLEVECAERSCDTRFVPSRKGHRFCSEKCGQRFVSREAARRRYQTDPAYREARKQQSREYREANRRAVLIQQAAWREENRARRRAAQRDYYQRNREREIARNVEYKRRKRAEAA